MAEQVVTLVAANNKLFMDLNPSIVKEFQMDLLKFMNESHADIMNELASRKTLEDDLRSRIIQAIEEFKADGKYKGN